MTTPHPLFVSAALAVWVASCDPARSPPDGAATADGGLDSLVEERDAPTPEAGIDRPLRIERPELPDQDADADTGQDADADRGQDADDAEEPAIELVDGCGAAAVDATVAGHRFGATTRLLRRASQLARGSVASLHRDGCPTVRATTRWFAVRYTPQAEARLSLSLARDYRRTPYHSVASAAVFADCEPGASARRVACGGLRGPLPDTAPFVTRDRLRAGRPVTIVVGLDPEDVTLSITEVAEEVPVGGPCDPAGAADACATGTTCAYRTGYGDATSLYGEGAGAWECRPDGARDTRCREAGAPCRDGLTCVDLRDDGRPAVCVDARRVGEACTADQTCIDSTCLVRPEGATCVANGARRARCRDGVPRCDPGLRCARTFENDTLCVPVLGEGAACEVAAEARCAEGEACAGGPGGARCARAGVAGGPCRDDGPWCDPGLRCESRLAATGGRCVVGEEAGGGEGARDTRCRAVEPACDAGLQCTVRGICESIGSCAGVEGYGACARNERCWGQCRPDGSRQGWCRATQPPCDAGLRCAADLVWAHGPRCIPAAAAPGPCFTEMSCARGERCGLTADGALRCTLASSFEVCVDAACPSGKRCLHGLCRPVVADGADCGPTTACAPGSTCVGYAVSSSQTCRRDRGRGGVCGPSGACDLGLVCQRDNSPYERCEAVSATGAACGSIRDRCDPPTACREFVCGEAGALDTPCRTGTPPCDPGLTCIGEVCRALVSTPGARCGYCASPLQCVPASDGVERCAAPTYDIALGEGATFEDPCAMPPEPLTTPLSVTIGGRTDPVVINDAGRLAVRSATPFDETMVLGPGVGTTTFLLSSLDTGSYCVRIAGTAPRRRLVIGERRARMFARTIDFYESLPPAAEAVIHEGTNVVEFHYAAQPSRLPYRPVRAWPGISATGTRAQLTEGLLVRSGTWVRFTPR